MPVHDLGNAIDVLQELPRQPALADAGLADDRDEPWLRVASRGVVEVLDQLQLALAADEGRLEPFAAPHAAALGDDAQRVIGAHRSCLALEILVAGRLEDDRVAGGPLRPLADEHRARLRHRLEPAGRVDEVARHHPHA